MSRSTGVSDSNYRPTQLEVLEDDLKAIQLLTINGDRVILQKQVEELIEKSKDNEYTIKGRLEEREKQIQDLKTEVTEIENMFKGFVSTVDKGGYRLLKRYHLAYFYWTYSGGFNTTFSSLSMLQVVLRNT